MPRRKKEQEPKRPAGRPRTDPTPAQKQRLSELQDRARQIYLLGEEDELWLQAAALIRDADEKIQSALDVRYMRRVSVDRPTYVPCDEILALEELERESVARERDEMARSGQHLEQTRAATRLFDAAMYPEPINRRVKAARCLLRYAEEMLRTEVAVAADTEEVPLRGESEAQIRDRLIKRELGLGGVAAARLLGKPADSEDAEGNAADRRANQSRKVSDPLKASFMIGLKDSIKRFKKSVADLSPRDHDKIDQIIRQTLTEAATYPEIDQGTVLVNTRIAAPVKARRKRKVVPG